jgi:hypothetical protein
MRRSPVSRRFRPWPVHAPIAHDTIAARGKMSLAAEGARVEGVAAGLACSRAKPWARCGIQDTYTGHTGHSSTARPKSSRRRGGVIMITDPRASGLRHVHVV